MKFDKEVAKTLLRAEAGATELETIDSHWTQLFENFSQSCQTSSKTHIAFLGTAILAKALDLGVDVFAVKAGAQGEGAYSARNLGHGVLVPLANELGINLGVTGREPLNNQPYFRIDRVSENIPVKGGTTHILHELCGILRELEKITDNEIAKTALRSFIFVRRQYQPSYLQRISLEGNLSSNALLALIETFVMDNSEGGKRAQAVVAGLMDLFAGYSRVETGRINDPDRHLPGDVGVRNQTDPEVWDKIFEVRDKSVTVEDIYIFANKALESRTREAAVIAVAPKQKTIEFLDVQHWSAERGLALSLFTGWHDFVTEALFWSEEPQISGPLRAAEFIYQRLIQLEVSEDGMAMWRESLDLAESLADD